MAQFIGGEPSLNPDLPTLVDHALGSGIQVEVYTNLAHVSPRLWETYSKSGVRLATSYYSDSYGEYDTITKRPGSYSRTKSNIAEAVRRSIPLRVGVIDVNDAQRTTQAHEELADLGVTTIHSDRLRQIGRGVRDTMDRASELCGSCAHGVLAISPEGDVWPCVFARWMPIGNVRSDTLSSILAGAAMANARAQLRGSDDDDDDKPGCNPRCCPSTMCNPKCSPSCSPSCRPANNCRPVGNCAPNY